MLLAIGVPVAAVFVVLAVFVGTLGAILPGGGDAACQTAPGRTAQADVPPAYLALYLKAAAQYGIPWNVLAAIGDAESDHGRGTGPGITSGTNHAGAAGPMQFLRSTWAAFGVDGNGDGRKNIYDPTDAIPAAARYLKHNGAPAHLERALHRYNHADWYVKKILRRAAEYGEGGSACPDVPIAATGRAAIAVKAALRWLGTPYSWGGGGLNGPTRGIARGAGIVGFDCSGLTRYAWHQAGVTIPRISQDQWKTLPHVPAGQEHPGDLVFFRGSGGTSGSPGHVGLVIGRGRMVEAPRTGLKVRISSIRNRSDLVGYARPTYRRS
ncbi:Transglycosylase SLT domain-containing protein [Thermomonospora echinospora]|uniref:Transglycosylase SLT domain-containing protein n=1 Tax=Thermomonospora echinospora TaxID=1992 RepID=A0A1H5YTH7_9ACTN|nr:NlpC/P60 family protein [Thermomonospora echinospora]SEG26616.1 Transglycosylase SLT domain-containing protein [Thermomonospora echinospora]